MQPNHKHEDCSITFLINQICFSRMTILPQRSWSQPYFRALRQSTPIDFAVKTPLIQPKQRNRFTVWATKLQNKPETHDTDSPARETQQSLGWLKSCFIWSLSCARERNFTQTVYVTRPKWKLCPYMVKSFTNLLLLQTPNDLETLSVASGTRILQILFSKMTMHWPWQMV